LPFIKLRKNTNPEPQNQEEATGVLSQASDYALDGRLLFTQPKPKRLEENVFI